MRQTSKIIILRRDFSFVGHRWNQFSIQRVRPAAWVLVPTKLSSCQFRSNARSISRRHARVRLWAIWRIPTVLHGVSYENTFVLVLKIIVNIFHSICNIHRIHILETDIIKLVFIFLDDVLKYIWFHSFLKKIYLGQELWKTKHTTFWFLIVEEFSSIHHVSQIR